ncbi:MAG: P-II family nitrogen regulator [Bacillota bacterium]|nr:P-II family nitrogen regulator [Bacillota bacterium]
MKEILAIIRIDKVNETKEALLKEGFPSITCRKVMGRGRKKVLYELFQNINESLNVMTAEVAEELSEVHRLMPKRLIIIVVKDEDVQKVVKTIISVNQNGRPGNGKIFVSTVDEVVRVRTGETDESAV